jgi:hypothetical protein
LKAKISLAFAADKKEQALACRMSLEPFTCTRPLIYSSALIAARGWCVMRRDTAFEKRTNHGWHLSS